MDIVKALRCGLKTWLAHDIDPATAAQYNAAVAAARQPVFYAAYAVPDSVDGRFDLILLHVFLVIRRLTDASARQRLFDLMFSDMDRSLREMGVGDMSIGKRMKPMLAGFYGRAGAYEKALATDGAEALAVALSRNLYGMSEGTAAHASVLARYVRACVDSLDAQQDSDIAHGRVFFAPREAAGKRGEP